MATEEQRTAGRRRRQPVDRPSPARQGGGGRAPRAARERPDDPPRDLRIALTGDLDLVAGEALEREIRDRMSATVDRIVVDLSAVGFLDSTGLRALISLRNAAKRNGRDLALVAGQPAVQRVFALTATRGLFDWVEEPERHR